MVKLTKNNNQLLHTIKFEKFLRFTNKKKLKDHSFTLALDYGHTAKFIKDQLNAFIYTDVFSLTHKNVYFAKILLKIIS